MVEAYPLVIKHGAMENTSLNAAAPETGGSTLTHTDLQGGSAGESWKIGATEPLANLGIILDTLRFRNDVVSCSVQLP